MAVGTRKYITIGISALVLAIILLIILFGVNRREDISDPQNFTEQFRSADWDAITAAASGQSVFWYMWGGSDAINIYVTDYLAARARDEWNINLELVPLTDTVDAVNKIIADKDAGNDNDGAIDLLWINGENFRTLRDGDLLFGPFADLLPNRALIASDSPALQYDYGYPIDDYESPYGAAQFVMIYDSDKIANPPRSIPALLQWIESNPGQFTYPLLPDFVGSAFVRHILYAQLDDINVLFEPFDEERFAQYTAPLWDTLNRLESSLWRQGETYPESQAALELLFANGEVLFDLSYNPAKGGTLVESGQYPPTTRSYVFDEGTISNNHYVAIPYNSKHKAAAMVVANLILDPLAQLEKNKAEVWGDPTVLTLDLLPPDIAAQFDALESHPSAASIRELDKGKLPEIDAEWVVAIERAWEDEVLKK